MERERRKALGHLRRAEFHAAKGDATSTRAHCARAVFYAPAFGESELRVVQIADRIANRVHVKLERLRSASAAEKAAAAALLAGGAGLLYHALSAGPALATAHDAPEPDPVFLHEPSTLSAVGITNGGNTCYLNAALQLLFSMSNVRGAMLGYSGPDATANALKGVFEGLSGKSTVGALTGETYDALNLVNAEKGKTACSDEALGSFLDWFRGQNFAWEGHGVTFRTQLRKVKDTKTFCSERDDDRVNMVQCGFTNSPNDVPGTVAGLLAADGLAESLTVTDEERAKEGTDTQSQSSRYIAPEESRYVVVQLKRLIQEIPEDFRTRTIVPGPIEIEGRLGRIYRYALVGAVVYGSSGNHYMFVRTSGLNVLRVYNDAVVTDGGCRNIIQTRAVVLLYQRLAEPVTAPGAP